MTTQVTVTTGPATLLQQSRQQITANRFRHAEQDADRRTEAAAIVARQQQLAQQNTTADGSIRYGAPIQPPFRRKQPAAYRTGGIKADFYVITYQFDEEDTGGNIQHLRSRTFLMDPVTQEWIRDPGEPFGIPFKFVGFLQADLFSNTLSIDGNTILTWGGDTNTLRPDPLYPNRGSESVMFNRLAYEQQFPGSSLPVISCHGVWLYEIGTITMLVTGYKGGAMVLDPVTHIWTNPTAVKTWNNAASMVSSNVDGTIFGGNTYITDLEINYSAGKVRFFQS